MPIGRPRTSRATRSWLRFWPRPYPALALIIACAAARLAPFYDMRVSLLQQAHRLVELDFAAG